MSAISIFCSILRPISSLSLSPPFYAQALDRRFLFAEDQVRFWASLCKIYDVISSTGTFSLVLRISPFTVISPTFRIHIFICHKLYVISVITSVNKYIKSNSCTLPFSRHIWCEKLWWFFLFCFKLVNLLLFHVRMVVLLARLMGSHLVKKYVQYFTNSGNLLETDTVGHQKADEPVSHLHSLLVIWDTGFRCVALLNLICTRGCFISTCTGQIVISIFTHRTKTSERLVVTKTEDVTIFYDAK